MADMKRSDQIALLETSRIFTDTGEWKGLFTYPGCGVDLVTSGLATEDGKITVAGRATLFLLGRGDDPTETKASVTFTIPMPDASQSRHTGPDEAGKPEQKQEL